MKPKLRQLGAAILVFGLAGGLVTIGAISGRAEISRQQPPAVMSAAGSGSAQQLTKAQSQAPGTAPAGPQAGTRTGARTGALAEAGTRKEPGKNLFFQTQTPFQHLASYRLLGTPVRDKSGKTIGDIEDLILSTDNRIIGVIMGVGGALGFGEKKIAVRISALQIKRDQNKPQIIMNATADELKGAPAYKETHRKKSLIERGTEATKKVLKKAARKTTETVAKAKEATRKAVVPAKPAKAAASAPTTAAPASAAN